MSTLTYTQHSCIKYIDEYVAEHGMDQAQDQLLHGSEKPDDEVVSALDKIIFACPAGFCRNKTLHETRAGFYARMFVRKGHSAYIGYSESIYYGLQYAYQKCWPASNCLDEGTIAVRRLPPFGAEGMEHGVEWVDALAIDASVSQEKKAAALAFISFVTSAEGYKAILRAAAAPLFATGTT
jgi:thiamine pyridinylase